LAASDATALAQPDYSIDNPATMLLDNLVQNARMKKVEEPVLLRQQVVKLQQALKK
jgi:hypothetical protein